jgi:hypothetical protein
MTLRSTGRLWKFIFVDEETSLGVDVGYKIFRHLFYLQLIIRNNHSCFDQGGEVIITLDHMFDSKPLTKLENKLSILIDHESKAHIVWRV